MARRALVKGDAQGKVRPRSPQGSDHCTPQRCRQRWRDPTRDPSLRPEASEPGDKANTQGAGKLHCSLCSQRAAAQVRARQALSQLLHLHSELSKHLIP